MVSSYISQVIFDFFRRKPLEAGSIAHAYFDIISCHLALKTLLERQDSRVDSVFEFYVLRVSSFEEGFAID